MGTKEHSRSMSAPERKLWVDVVLKLLETRHTISSTDIHQVAELADQVVGQYRSRVTWRQS